MSEVRLCGWQCGGFHGWGRRHFIQIQAVSQHPAEKENVLILHPLGARPPPRTPTHTSASISPSSPTAGDTSLPSYLRPAVPAVALGPLPCDKEAGLLLGKAPEQLEVRDEVQDVVVTGQLSPLGTRLHGHGPATPALSQPPANSGTRWGQAWAASSTPAPWGHPTRELDIPALRVTRNVPGVMLCLGG